MNLCLMKWRKWLKGKCSYFSSHRDSYYENTRIAMDGDLSKEKALTQAFLPTPEDIQLLTPV